MKKDFFLRKFAKSLEIKFIIYYNIGVKCDENELFQVKTFKNAKKGVKEYEVSAYDEGGAKGSLRISSFGIQRI